MARDEAYLIAEKKIDEARRTGAKKLDLSGSYGDKKPKLTELPESLGQLTQLQSLDLSNNQLTILPEWLGQLTQLQSLDLSDTQLTALPEWLVQLTQLQSLDLSDTQLTALPEWLVQLTQLQRLNLSGNQLTALPEWLVQLTQLQRLNLSRIQLMALLPEWLGRLVQLKSLDLSGNQLTALPEWLVQLTQLQELNLSGNQLTALPEWLGRLAQLQSLDLSHNQLKVLPEALVQLTQLRMLSIDDNRLQALPDWFESLRNLEMLGANNVGITSLPVGMHCLSRLRFVRCCNNPISEFPKSIRGLKQLESLYIGGTELRTLPDWISELTTLKLLHIHKNRLSELPLSLLDLPNLDRLLLDDNPLSPDLATAYEQDIEGVKRYLREMAKGGKPRYEAKLLILGDGNEGKTCISRALRNLPFKEQSTTHGVDVEQWMFPHPDDPLDKKKTITLNIWDFEGQEISHQTHQFFLTSQALYLLVFKCRDLFLMDRAEYWLDTIRARAPKAKVAIVISQCEARSPHVPLDKIEAQYSDMLANEWFFAVGCKNGKNIEKLQTFLQRSAVGLNFMGSPWPQSYERTELEIKKKAKTRMAHLSRTKLNAILRKSGVSEDNFDGAAGAMARIGAITQFPDSPDLGNFVVLKPQWLTKAISKVMEDGKLSEDKGEIEMKRMEAIWNKEEFRGMFSTFHNCMKEFELCYDLEDHGKSCLVPLRFGYVPPTIPWTVAPGLKERRMEYKLNIRPPMGIMSRFIVKTHHMIVRTLEQPKGVYWHNGVFLKTNSPVPSEALCEFSPDERVLRVQVRAAFPQNFCEQIHGYIQAVFSFFAGLSAERSYGCIKVDAETKVEAQCKGLHTEKRIYTAISKERETMDCEFEEHEVDPRLLVSGLSSFGGFIETKLAMIVRNEMDKTPVWAVPWLHNVQSLLSWVQTNSTQLEQVLYKQDALSAEFKQEAELKLHEYLRCVSAMLDDREHMAAPGLISIITKDRSPWNPTRFFNQTYILTPYCECEGNIHACEDGSVEFTQDKKWWIESAPWVARGTKLLAAGLQLAFAGMPLAMGAETAKAVEDQVKLMEELTKHLELEMPPEQREDGSIKVLEGAVGKDLRGNDRETALTRAALAMLLEKVAPNNYRAKTWGSLRRRMMSDNSYRWLCDACAKRVH